MLNLSERLAVSRSSFYWYFKNRDELLDALLDRWDRLNTRSIVRQTQAPAATVNQAVCNVFRCWVDPAIFSPRLDPPFGSGLAAPRKSAMRSSVRPEGQTRSRRCSSHGYGCDDAFVRARVLYYMQIGYYSLDIREPMEARLALTPHYLEAFTGVAPGETKSPRSAPTRLAAPPRSILREANDEPALFRIGPSAQELRRSQGMAPGLAQGEAEADL